MDHNAILNMDPVEMVSWLSNEFLVAVPEEIVTVDDMTRAAKLLLRLSSSYSYLCVLHTHAKITTRELKRGGNRAAYEDMIDRRDAIGCITEAVKQQYAAISRSVTIKIENNKELQMNASGSIRQ